MNRVLNGTRVLQGLIPGWTSVLSWLFNSTPVDFSPMQPFASIFPLGDERMITGTYLGGMSCQFVHVVSHMLFFSDAVCLKRHRKLSQCRSRDGSTLDGVQEAGQSGLHLVATTLEGGGDARIYVPCWSKRSQLKR